MKYGSNPLGTPALEMSSAATLRKCGLRCGAPRLLAGDGGGQLAGGGGERDHCALLQLGVFEVRLEGLQHRRRRAQLRSATGFTTVQY